jgi:RNA polymerase sigma-70 factor (ECF subfamily)
MAPESDAELLRLSRAGDHAAFGRLVERYAPLVRRLTASVLRHAEDADDAAQEAFLSAWTALGQHDAGRSFGPWMARIALNAARDLARRRRVRATEPLPPELAGQGPGTDQMAERGDLRRRLGAALAALPERQRVAVVLFEVEGYSHAEIGELLGMPEGTARSEVFHARRQLRAALGGGTEAPR